jgi:Skp family chaperone for outer membrane proteins
MLEMALIGYEAERQKVQEKIAEIQAQLNGRPRRAATPVARIKRKMSAAARRRIAAAQKKRWAEFHKKQQKAA